MIAYAQAVVKNVDQNNVVFEVSCFGLTKTVVEPLAGRNSMLGWNWSFQVGQSLIVDISTDPDPEEAATGKWSVCAIKQPTPELVCTT